MKSRSNILPTKKEQRAISNRLNNLRNALINHCVNWRDFFEVTDINQVPDADLIKFSENVGGLKSHTFPWIVNSKDETQDFKILENPVGIFASHVAVDSSISDVIEVLMPGKFHLSWATAPHMKKPVYRLKFMDIGYIRQISKITPIDLMNRITERLTGIREILSGNNKSGISVVIQAESTKISTRRFNSGNKIRDIITIKPTNMLPNVEKVILTLERHLDFVGIPIILFVLQETDSSKELIAETKIVNQFLLEIINSF